MEFVSSKSTTTLDPSPVLIPVPNLDSGVAHICPPGHYLSNEPRSVWSFAPSLLPRFVSNLAPSSFSSCLISSDPHFLPYIEPSFFPSCVPSLHPSAVHRYVVLSFVPKPDPSFDPIVSVSSFYSRFIDLSLVPDSVLSAVDCAHSTITCVHHQLMRENRSKIKHQPEPEICPHCDELTLQLLEFHKLCFHLWDKHPINDLSFDPTICVQWIQHFAHSELQNHNPVNSLLFSWDDEPIRLIEVNKCKTVITALQLASLML